MSTMVSLYFQVSFFIFLAFVLFRFVLCLSDYRVLFTSEQQKLKLGYLLFSLGILLPMLMEFFPKQALPTSIFEFYTPQVFQNIELGRDLSRPSVQSISAEFQGVQLSWPNLLQIFVFLSIMFGILSLIVRALQLRSYLAKLPRIKRIGSLELKVDDRPIIPFAAQLFSHLYVVFPQGLLTSQKTLTAVLCHELQHIRQRDTLWIYLIELTKKIFIWNPAAHFWSRILEDQQEFACDEALIGHEKISPKAYGRYLWEVASFSMGSRNMLAGTTSMFLRPDRNALKRRIKMLTRYKKNSFRRGTFFLISLGTLSVLITTAIMAKGVVSDRNISREEAQRLVETTSQKLKFPLVLDDLVLDKLNKFATTQEGRKFMKASLERMKEHRSLIEEKLSKKNLPQALLAIPIVESGFQNLNGPRADGEFAKPKGKPSKGFNLEGESLAPGYRGAGLWMFIPETAKTYGLRVSKDVDDRNDVEKETDAAVHYLSDLKEEFGDWPLAIAAYNHGSKKVRKAIEKGGSKNAWELARKKEINEYLSGVAAAMIVMNNPQILD